MATLEQIQQDLQTLPQDALDLLAQFIQLLKKSQVAAQEHNSASEPSLVADAIDRSDFTGSIEAENLDDTPLPSLIGSAPGSFTTPATADQFIRQERDSWDS